MVPVSCEPHPETPYERCCQCARPTPYWYLPKDVALCRDCAKTMTAAQVPSKKQWFAMEAARLAARKGGAVSTPSKKQITQKKPHGLCRPSRGAQQVERLAANGHWYPDNGKPAVAFSGTDNRDVPYAWRTRCSCLAFDKVCPATEASRRTCERFGAANGFERPRVR